MSQPLTEGRLDMNRHLVKNALATYYVRAPQDVAGVDVRAGDLLVVDRSLEPANGNTVVVDTAGALSVCVWSADEEAEVWGVVTYTVRDLRRDLAAGEEWPEVIGDK